VAVCELVVVIEAKNRELSQWESFKEFRSDSKYSESKYHVNFREVKGEGISHGRY
jgi:hypothetical protein